MSIYRENILSLVESITELEEFEVPQQKFTEFSDHNVNREATFREAKLLDEKGEYQKAGDIYVHLAKHSDKDREKAQAFVLIAQMYINLTAYDLALTSLDKNIRQIKKLDLDDWEKDYYLGQVYEKYGWVYDLIGEPQKAIESLLKAKRIVKPHIEKNNKVVKTLETIDHFLGRQYTMATWIDHDIEPANTALKYFNEALKLDMLLKKHGIEVDGAIGFQFLWRARVNMLQGNLASANSDLSETKDYFDNEVRENRGAGLMAYYEIQKGRLAIEEGEWDVAEDFFQNSFESNSNNYPKNRADSLCGIAVIAQYRNDRELAVKLIYEALEVFPYLIKRHFL